MDETDNSASLLPTELPALPEHIGVFDPECTKIPARSMMAAGLQKLNPVHTGCGKEYNQYDILNIF
jgi:hypothetical protein